jgi:hypothetical protein
MRKRKITLAIYLQHHLHPTKFSHRVFNYTRVSRVLTHCTTLQLVELIAGMTNEHD